MACLSQAITGHAGYARQSKRLVMAVPLMPCGGMWTGSRAQRRGALLHARVGQQHRGRLDIVGVDPTGFGANKMLLSRPRRHQRSGVPAEHALDGRAVGGCATDREVTAPSWSAASSAQKKGTTRGDGPMEPWWSSTARCVGLVWHWTVSGACVGLLVCRSRPGWGESDAAAN
jgi:hypothetical protein